MGAADGGTAEVQPRRVCPCRVVRLTWRGNGATKMQVCEVRHAPLDLLFLSLYLFFLSCSTSLCLDNRQVLILTTV